MKPIKTLATLELLIKNKIDVYDRQGHEIPIIQYMYNRLYDVWMDIQNENILYNPADLEG